VFAFCGDVAGALVLGLFVPVAVLLVGVPLVLGVRVILELFGRP
jgi:hypothetical protein